MTLLDRDKHDPWQLKTAPGTSDYTMHVDTRDGTRVLVCTVGKTVLHYDARCVDDLHAMLREAGDWVELAAPTSTSPPRKAVSRPGADRRRTPSVAGTA